MSALLASVAAIALLPLAAQIVACSTDAVGIEACRSIESARCKLAPLCASVKGNPKIKTTLEVNNCVDYYHDHCLVGIENTAKGDPDKTKVTACTDALNATGACQSSGKATMADCAGVVVDNATLTPCQVMAVPEHLSACLFIETQTTATGTATSSTATGTGTGGGGGAGGSGGSGG